MGSASNGHSYNLSNDGHLSEQDSRKLASVGFKKVGLNTAYVYALDVCQVDVNMHA